jgi:hypothetical protein
MHINRLLFILSTLFISIGFSQQTPYSKLCECINMGEDMTVECHELKQAWKQEYEGATAERKTQMKNQFEDCRDYQKMIDSPSICTCVQIDPKKWTKECVSIKKAWDKDYQKAEGDERTAMKQEILDCGEEVNEAKDPTTTNLNLSDEDFCTCSELIGEVLTLSKGGKDEDAAEIYLRQNKVAFDDCKSKMKGFNINEDAFIERAYNCSDLKKYFKKKGHYFYKRKEDYDQLRKDVCYCVVKAKEMTTEIEDAGGNEVVLDDITKKYQTIMIKCEKLTEGKTEVEIKKMKELAKKCKD